MAQARVAMADEPEGLATAHTLNEPVHRRHKRGAGRRSGEAGVDAPYAVALAEGGHIGADWVVEPVAEGRAARYTLALLAVHVERVAERRAPPIDHHILVARQRARPCILHRADDNVPKAR